MTDPNSNFDPNFDPKLDPKFDPDITSLPLADLLKASTKPLHTQAEKTGVVADIIRQRVSLQDYTGFIQNLIEVYKTLEGETAWLDQYPALAPYITAALYRQARLKDDYAHLRSLAAPLSAAPLHAETWAYCEHIASSRRSAPPAMVAHIYVRYLGDLNGGQVLQRLLQSSLGLPPEALSFYAFPAIPDLNQFRSGFRDALNAIELTQSERAIAQQAAAEAFRLNIALSSACQNHHRI